MDYLPILPMGDSSTVRFRRSKSRSSHISHSTPQSDVNPYQSPEEFVRKAFRTESLLLRGFLMVNCSGLFFALIGSGVGALIGWAMPDYYIAMFPQIISEQLVAWKFGAAMGLTQGLVGGLVIGCVLLLSVTWYKSRMNNSISAMIAQAYALQGASPEIEEPNVDLSRLKKSKSRPSKSES